MAGATEDARAHGEESQQAFLRMRTIYWYDLQWSTDKLRVNDKMTVSGKFHVFEDWPKTAANPETPPAFLNIDVPGQPVLTRVELSIGGQFVPRSVNLELGKNYAFNVVLQARHPGRWHVHTMMKVGAADPIIGPGKWVEIEGSMADYKHTVTTLTGNTEDIEKWSTGGIYGWTFFWIFFGIAWVGYWAAKPVFLPRYLARKAGDESIVSPTDVKVGLGFMVATIAITWFAYNSGNSSYPITVPLQAGVIGKVTPIPEGPVAGTLEKATYLVPGRSIILKVQVNNRGTNSIQVSEFETPGIRLLNASVHKDDTNSPPQSLASEGLSVDDNSPIWPGQSKVVTITARWENERIADANYGPDSRIGGMLFFVDDSGNRSMVPIEGPLLLSFTVEGSMASTAELDYEVRRTFFATDRNMTGKTKPDEMFEDGRSSLTYGTCDVSIPRGHRIGELESPSIWRLKIREDPTKHVVLLSTAIRSKDEFFADVAARVRESARSSAFLFVHGYNVTFKDAARRTAQIASDLNFEGAPVFYSWPSQGTTPAYTVDEQNIEWAQANLRGFLEDFFTRSDAQSVYLIAHSMGNRALTRAVASLLTDKPALRNRLQEVILTAPDIDAEVFKRDIAPALTAAGRPITMYASSDDLALVASKKVHGYPRAGDSGQGLVVVAGIETIDATGMDTSFLGHSYFAETRSVLSDMFNIVRNGQRADQRFGLRRMDTKAGQYWVFMQ